MKIDENGVGSAHGSFYGNKRLYLVEGEDRQGGPATDLKTKNKKKSTKNDDFRLRKVMRILQRGEEF